MEARLRFFRLGIRLVERAPTGHSIRGLINDFVRVRCEFLETLNKADCLGRIVFAILAMAAGAFESF